MCEKRMWRSEVNPEEVVLYFHQWTWEGGSNWGHQVCQASAFTC